MAPAVVPQAVEPAAAAAAAPSRWQQFGFRDQQAANEEISSLAGSVSSSLSLSCPPVMTTDSSGSAPLDAPPLWGYDDYDAAASCQLWNDDDPFFFDI